MFDLVVTTPFAGFQVGERITDRALVEAHRDSPFVVKVAASPQEQDKPARRPHKD